MKDFPSKPLCIVPSILSGDFGRLAEEAKRIEDSGADGVHIDIMDGHFVPNLTMGPKAVEAIRRATSLFLDVHLMIYHPFDYVEPFIASGADGITVHFEATEEIEEVLQFIQKCGKWVGLAFNPETSFTFVPKLIAFCDFILFMTVHPGFGGQKFLPQVLEKIALTRKMCDMLSLQRKKGIDSKQPLPFMIQVDGGIQEKTAKECIKAGANCLVSGNYFFSFPNLKEGIDRLARLSKNL